VLKGGNAIDLLQPRAASKLSRASYDLDFSIEDNFDEDLEAITTRIEKIIKETFTEKDLIVLDYQFTQKPKTMREDLKDFQGGYCIEFKLITAAEFIAIQNS
jgi:hypothetical protein